MSTSASISVLVGTRVKMIVTTFDGSPSHHGRILTGHYNTQELAEAVVSLGDLSSLAECMAVPEQCNRASPDEHDHSIAYGRDRGEAGVEAKDYASFEEAMLHRSEQYNYFWNGNQWILEGLAISKPSAVVPAEGCDCGKAYEMKVTTALQLIQDEIRWSPPFFNQCKARIKRICDAVLYDQELPLRPTNGCEPMVGPS